MATIAGCGPNQISENNLAFETGKGTTNRDGTASIVAGASGWTVTGDTNVSAGTLTAGAAYASGAVILTDGASLAIRGAGTGTGDLVEIIGPDATHGWARYVYEATVAPAAIETALVTVPAESVVEAVQANVQTALTGGGTTVTFGVGVTGDVDAYGTAGAPTNLLTINAKLNYSGAGNAPGAGAAIGSFSKAAVGLKLIGAAAGGAAAGDTALTVGTVKVRVVYRTLLPMANA